MNTVYLSRRNLEVLLEKLDQNKKGGKSLCTLIKTDTTHKQFPCTDITTVIAVEDSEYYTDRLSGEVHHSHNRPLVGRKVN